MDPESVYESLLGTVYVTQEDGVSVCVRDCVCVPVYEREGHCVCVCVCDYVCVEWCVKGTL